MVSNVSHTKIRKVKTDSEVVGDTWCNQKPASGSHIEGLALGRRGSLVDRARVVYFLATQFVVFGTASRQGWSMNQALDIRSFTLLCVAFD